MVSIKARCQCLLQILKVLPRMLSNQACGPRTKIFLPSPSLLLHKCDLFLCSHKLLRRCRLQRPLPILLSAHRATSLLTRTRRCRQGRLLLLGLPQPCSPRRRVMDRRGPLFTPRVPPHPPATRCPCQVQYLLTPTNLHPLILLSLPPEKTS